jgi:hypothetical protein
MKLADTLEISTPSDQEVRLTRLFDAPRALVFDAFTRPELLTKDARDIAMKTGMKDGMVAGYDRLDAVFAERAR